MSKISVYNVVPTPKLGDKLIGTSIGVVDDVFYDVTYNFTLQELLDLFIPNLPANNLQGILDYGNTATQNINLTGTIKTTNLNVLATATILNSVFNGETHVLGQLYDRLNSSGTAGQILKSTGSGVEWYTIPDAIIPTLQQVLTSGNIADKNIILSANISAATATANNVVSNTSLNVNGTLKDGSSLVGTANQVLSSTGTKVQWVDLPLYFAVSPLLYNNSTKTFSIQVANSAQSGYLSNFDWINFDAKQNPITLTTTGNSGAATFVGSVLNIPAYTLSGLGGVASVTATSPLLSSGGQNPVISIPMANTSQSGYLSNIDWNKFNNKLSSVGISMPSAFTVTNSPLTSNGTISISGSGTSSQYIDGTGSLQTFPTVINEAAALVTEVYNETGATLTKGTVVYINGGHGNLPTVAKALATSDATSAQTYGVVQVDITNMNSGHVVVIGSLGDLDTRLYSNGTQLYLSSTTAGAWTDVKQYAPAHLVYVGVVVRSHPTQGVVEIKIQNGYELDELHNVSAQTPSNGSILQYVASTQLWTSVAGTTTNIAEGTNLYYLDSRARAALSFVAGSGAYNNTTGVITIPTNTSQLTNGASFITLNSLSAVSPLSYNNTIGVFSISQATTSVSGYLSATDWNTFNNKQDALTLTTTGTSGAATLVGNTLNIPQYQSVLTNPITGTGTANYVPKFSAATTITNSNIQDDGTLITLGSNTYVNGAMGIGTTSLTGYNLRVAKNLTGSTSVYNIASFGTIQSDATSSASYFETSAATQATAFTIGSLRHFYANQSTIGAGSVVTSQYGFLVGATLVGATNNYAFFGDIPSGTNRWNLYMSGTANNYLAGSLGIGSTSLTGYNLRITKNITGATISYGTEVSSITNSDVTTQSVYYSTTANTIAATFTLGALIHYSAYQGTFGAGSTITNQYGFYAQSTLTGATNNYGFRGAIPSGTGRYNLYMDGTANNYMAGSLGIGSTALTGYNLRVSKNITGATFSYGIIQDGTIQSDVTSVVQSFTSSLNTQASAFALTNYSHYIAQQGTIGAGSSVTTQSGFYAISNLTGATNNYGFRGAIPAQANTYNLYMDGTANNYLAGSLGIGTTSLTGYNLRIGKTITGSVSATSIMNESSIQSDVTSAATYYGTFASTQATAFALGTVNHYYANQGTIGAGSSVSSQYGFRVDASLIGATNNYGFRGAIPAQTGAWNIYMDGTANNYLAGSLGIGTFSLTGYNLRVQKNITGSTTSYGIFNEGTIQSDVTSQVLYHQVLSNTAAASFTLNNLFYYNASQGTFGAGSSVSTQTGFNVNSTLIGATNNYGFRGQILTGTGRWNIYMDGTADNYMAGGLGIGTTSLTGYNLRISKAITGSSSAIGVQLDGTIQSDVTVNGYGFINFLSTQAASFNLSSYTHYTANQSTIGAGSSVTNQYGFLASSNLTGATNNYGFYGNISAGTNRWNLYMNGTAQNYLAGALSIGVTTANASAQLQVDSTTKGFLPPRMTSAQRTAIATPAEGLVVFQTDGTVGLYLYASAAWHGITML